MTRIDPDHEHARLSDLYSHQTDGELRVAAAQAFELTEQAREILRAELVKRNLDVAMLEYAPGDEAAFRPLVTIRTFRDLPQALLAKGSLDSAGIDCSLADEIIVRLDWFLSTGMGGIKLRVDPENVDAANEILSQPIPPVFEAEGTGEFEQPRCPKCGSLDINFREVSPIAYATTMVLSFPLPLYRRAWRCHSCDVEWEDDGIPNPTESQRD